MPGRHQSIHVVYAQSAANEASNLSDGWTSYITSPALSTKRDGNLAKLKDERHSGISLPVYQCERRCDTAKQKQL